jgi:cobalamin synthase
VIAFFERVLNAQLAVILLAGFTATVLRINNLISPEIWMNVVNTAVYLFVGGGLLKDGLASLTKKEST